MGLYLNATNWNMGGALLLLMFAAVTLGGLGTAFGALVGSIVIGLVVELTNLVLPSDIRYARALLILILVLLFRPQGIFGRARADRLRSRPWTGPASSPPSPARPSRRRRPPTRSAPIGLNVHFGLTGLLNMGQAGFLLLGAYGFAIATIAGWPLFAAVLVAMAAAAVFALILGIPTLKLRGDYLAIVTIAAAEIVRLVGRSTALTDLTGGSYGHHRQRLQGHVHRRLAPPGQHDWSWARSRTTTTRRTAGGSASSRGSSSASRACSSGCSCRSPVGPGAQGHPRGRGRRPLAWARTSTRYKMQSLVLGGVIGAVAGIIYVLPRAVQPDSMGRPMTFFIWTILLLGGAATVFGPVLGLDHLLGRPHADQDGHARRRPGRRSCGASRSRQFGWIIVGVTLMLLVIFRPQGILGDKKELAINVR